MKSKQTKGSILVNINAAKIISFIPVLNLLTNLSRFEMRKIVSLSYGPHSNLSYMNNSLKTQPIIILKENYFFKFAVV